MNSYKALKPRHGVLVLALLSALSVTASPAMAQAVPQQPAMAGQSEVMPPLNAVIGKSMLIRLPAPVARMSVGNPVVADVNLINPTELYLLGKEIGSTNLIVWYRGGGTSVMDINVNIDTASLESQLRQLMPGERDIHVSTASDSIVLQGTVSDSAKVDQALNIAQAYVRKANRSLVTDVKMPGKEQAVNISLANSQGAAGTVQAAGAQIINMLRVNAPQQVMLEVKVAEINKTMAEKLGFDFVRQFTGGGGAWTKTISGIVGGGAGNFNKNVNSTQKISAFTPAEGNSPPVQMLLPTNSNMNAQDFTSWLVDAQKKDGLIKILAEPNIVAISGQEGSFLAGGEILIPVPGNDGKVTLESKQFGVGLKFIPTVLEEGRINIKVSPEVTDLVGFNPVATTGLGAAVVVPTFTTRRVSTTVQLREGQSLAIGGLLQDNFQQQVDRFPILGEIPIVGALFRSSDYKKNKTELLIVVTPRLMKPLAPDYILPTDGFVEPSRSEMLFGGKMEGEKPKTDQPESKASAESKPASGGFEMK